MQQPPKRLKTADSHLGAIASSIGNKNDIL